MPRTNRKLRKSIATVALSGTLIDKLEAAATVGFDGVEIMESDLLTFDGSPEDVRRVAEELGLNIDIYQPFRDFEAMPDPQRRRNMDRARALLIPDWRERIGEGERRIPAVRGPDGTLVYLVSRDATGTSFWEDDFNLHPAETDGAGLTAIDHLAIALPAGRMDMFVLFWRSLFGLEPQPIWDLPDPYGLIQSRAMVSPTGSVRLTFNVSEARETATNRFISAFAGAGVQHIAFATPDAAASAGSLEQSGAPKLAIPANYYEDVAARLGLDDDVTAELERLGLLYDRDAQGEFRHTYTETFHDRFFFEITERRDGYAGFGAANAAVRMAAQARRVPPQF